MNEKQTRVICTVICSQVTIPPAKSLFLSKDEAILENKNNSTNTAIMFVVLSSCNIVKVHQCVHLLIIFIYLLTGAFSA